MQCARLTAWGLGLGLGWLGGSAAVAQEPRAEPLILRLANLTAAPESARVGFAFDLEGPPLVDELPAGSLTTLLPGRAELGELWILPRGQTLPKSLPEPLPLPLAGVRSPGAAPILSASAGIPSGIMTVFLIDRPGSRGDFVRKLVIGAPAPAEAAQLRVLSLMGAAELDVCAPGEATAPVARAVPPWGLSRFVPWAQWAAAGAGTALTFRVASAPACRGPKLGAVPLRLAERGAWTLVATSTAASPIDARDGAPALRVMLLDEGSLLPERAAALPVSPGEGHR